MGQLCIRLTLGLPFSGLDDREAVCSLLDPIAGSAHIGIAHAVGLPCCPLSASGAGRVRFGSLWIFRQAGESYTLSTFRAFVAGHPGELVAFGTAATYLKELI